MGQRHGRFKTGTAGLLAEVGEIGHQLFPQGFFADHTDADGQGLGFPGGQLKQIPRQPGVVLACSGTAAVNTGKTDKHHRTVTVSLHRVAQGPVGHGENLAKYIIRAVVFQKGIFSLAVHAVKMGPAAEQHAQMLQLRGIYDDGLALFEAAGLRLEAVHDRLNTALVKALKQLHFLHFSTPPFK